MAGQARIRRADFKIVLRNMKHAIHWFKSRVFDWGGERSSGLRRHNIISEPGLSDSHSD